MRLRFTALGGALLAVAIPVGAHANVGTSGSYVLDLEVSAKPAKPSTTKPAGVALSYSQKLTTKSGERPSQDVSKITITVPKGFQFNLGAFPQCKFSAVDKANTNGADPATGCPKASQIGTGTATADARPTLADPVPATVRGFAGVDDEDLKGNPRTPIPAIVITATAKVSTATVYSYFAADVVAANRLEVPFPPNTTGQQSLFVLQQLTLNLKNLTGKKGAPLVQAPKTCTGSWTFTQTTKFADGSSVTAKDAVPCSKPKV
jgi:hypothetical protein